MTDDRIFVYKRQDGNGYGAIAKDGTERSVVGKGCTEDEARQSVAQSLDARQRFLSLPICDQLWIITHEDEDLSAQKMSDAIKLLAKIVLDKSV